jgi:hypothetical protein
MNFHLLFVNLGGGEFILPLLLVLLLVGGYKLYNKFQSGK